MPNQETLISCRVCDQLFFDNRSLFDHYMRLHVESFKSSVNGINFSSGSSQITCFTSVPMCVVDSSVNRYFGPNSSERVTPTSDLSVDGNYVVPTPSRNFVQLSGHASTPRSQLYPSSSNLHSAISTSTLSSRPKLPSSSSSRFASQPTGQPIFHSPRSHTTLGISKSQFSASTSKPIGFGALTSESISGDTSSLSRSMMKKTLLESTRQSEVQNRVTGYTKPYIMQLEHPIEGMSVTGPNDNGGGNFKPDEIDLTLKL